MLVMPIKHKLFLMNYDKLIEITDEQQTMWDKAMKMIDVLGRHEAIKLYNEKYPKEKV